MTLPFTLPDIHHGFTSGHGFAELVGDDLVLRIRQKSLGMIDLKPLRIEIAVTAIDRIQVQRGLFGDKLIIRPFRPDLLDAVPGDHKAEVTLKIRKRDRTDAEYLVADVLDAQERLEA